MRRLLSPLFSRFTTSSKWQSYKQIQLQKWQYETNFMRSSGPGGQSVNTTNSKAEIRLNLNVCSLIDEHIMNNLKLKYANHINKENQLIVRSQVHKSQNKNLDDCYQRIQKILFQCSIVVPERSDQPFEEPEENREKRLASKKKRSQIKKNRGNKYTDY